MKNLIYILAVCLLAGACSKGDYEALSTESGTGGSMACFTIMGNYLYTVDVSTIKVFDIQQPTQPVLVGTKYLGFNIETIFNNGKNLYVGSQNGVYILDASNPSNPNVLYNYQHIQSCDPVIADTTYAYVTLNTIESFCGNTVNELRIINISNVYSPYLVKTYSLTGPKGLGKNDTALFVCDNLLKVYDCRNVNNLLLMSTHNLSARDVIVNDSILLVIGDNGFSQYLINGWNLDLLSSIPVNQ